MPVDDILMDCEEQMEKAIEHLKHELRSIRTGRASPALVENVKVEYYGAMTDLRATEIQADVVLKATKVDGIYSADPKKNPDAKLFRKISFEQVHQQQLRVMDLTAITLCMERRIPLVVFNMKQSGNIARVMLGEDVGTKIEP